MRYEGKILNSIQKFDLNLHGRMVLTEAASGNYVVTPVIAAAAGAQVTALTRDSVYGSVEEVRQQTFDLADAMNVADRIQIVTDISSMDLGRFDIVTNCGFLRPLNRNFVSRLSSSCVIPLMYEPWEFREGEIDLAACREKGIKVYGTNESDPRLRTMDYIGLTVLYLLLNEKLSPFSANILVLGCNQFVEPIARTLQGNGYNYKVVTNYDETINPSEFDAIVVAEYSDARLLIGTDPESYINVRKIEPQTHLIHIAGNVDLVGAGFSFTPEQPRPFRFMSYTTDFIDPQAVIDLHTAGLKVGEGMLEANQLGLPADESRLWIESRYPALLLS